MGAGQKPTLMRLPDGSRSVQSPWVWRGFLFMSLIAFGLCIAFFTDGQGLFAVAWLVITAGWLGISMWLWRRHVKDDDAAWRASKQASKQTGKQASKQGSRPAA